MSRFDLLYEARRALERAIDLDDLMAAVFADHPDLQTLEFDVTNEYDDNNYSDYTRLSKVNGWSVDYEGEYEDDEDDGPDLPRASVEACYAAINLCDFVKEKYGYGEMKFKREDYPFAESELRVRNNPSLDCAVAFLRGERVPVDTIIAAEGAWWMRHAQAHGRYSPEDEYKVFAREGWMHAAQMYAEEFGPLSEKTLNYFLLTLRKDSEGYDDLQKYLDWLKDRAA